jgi:kinesin family protein 5
VADILKGYNCTIFAYGQTSAGKTYTMMNTKVSHGADNRGLAPRVVEHLFDSIDKADPNLEFTVKTSFFEIYMERIFDLIERKSASLILTIKANKVNLQVKEDTSSKGFYVDNLTENYVSSDAEVLNYLKIGNANKKISSTSMFNLQ